MLFALSEFAASSSLFLIFVRLDKFLGAILKVAIVVSDNRPIDNQKRRLGEVVCSGKWLPQRFYER